MICKTLLFCGLRNYWYLSSHSAMSRLPDLMWAIQLFYELTWPAKLGTLTLPLSIRCESMSVVLALRSEFFNTSHPCPCVC